MNINRAISIRQPWASCIATGAEGAKRVENRGRPTSYRGLVVIHASLQPDVAADTDPRVTALWGRDPRLGMPVGVVLAVADLVDCHQSDWPDDEPACCFPWGDLFYGDGLAPAWHLVLDNVIVLDRPVPAKGKLGVPWTLPDDLATQVTEQVGVTP